MHRALALLALTATTAGAYEADGPSCKAYPRRDVLSIRLPLRVAALVICHGPGTLDTGVEVTTVNVLAVTKKGDVYCESRMHLEPTTGETLFVEHDTCGFPPT